MPEAGSPQDETRRLSGGLELVIASSCKERGNLTTDNEAIGLSVEKRDCRVAPLLAMTPKGVCLEGAKNAQFKR